MSHCWVTHIILINDGVCCLTVNVCMLFIDYLYLSQRSNVHLVSSNTNDIQTTQCQWNNKQVQKTNEEPWMNFASNKWTTDFF